MASRRSGNSCLCGVVNPHHAHFLQYSTYGCIKILINAKGKRGGGAGQLNHISATLKRFIRQNITDADCLASRQ